MRGKNPSPPQWDRDMACSHRSTGLETIRLRCTSSTRWGCNQRKQRIMRFRQSYVPWTNVRAQKSQSIPSQYQHPTILWALQQTARRYMQETYWWPTLGRDREKTRSRRTHVGSDQDYVACIIGGTLTKTLTEPGKESLQDYYTRTIRSLATQVSLGHKLDPDIDQAMDFTYKLDRISFQPMITNMDWLEVSEIRKFQMALKADNAIVYVTIEGLANHQP